jgi:tetratricopeptide (TPR) repeat protein
MSILQRVETSHPDFLDAYRLLSERLIQQGQYQRVRDILEPTIRSLKPRSQEAKEIYYLLALACIKDNLVEKAKECLEQVLDIDYSFKDASQLYDSLLSGSGAG